MSIYLHPYLNFKDNARQAMEFYQSIFGGELNISTFNEYQASDDPSEGNKVMHAMLSGGNGIEFMAADTPNRMEYKPGSNYSMSLSGDNEAELRRYYEKLAVGGTVLQPLEQAPWGDHFGMIKDQFGVDWFVNISPPKA